MTDETLTGEQVTDEQVNEFFDNPPENVPEDTKPEEQQSEEQKSEEQKPEEQKMVRLEALHEERMRRKELAAELADERRKSEEFRAIVEKRLEALAPKAPEVKYEEDPAEYLRRQTEELKQRQLAYEQWMSQSHEQQTQQAQSTRVQQHVAALEAEFSKSTPDYNDALNYVRDIRVKELSAIGYTQQEIENALVRDAWNIAQTSLQRERNPAQAVYEIAKSLGYKRPQENKPENKLENIQKGMKEGVPIKGGSPQKLSIEALANMSDAEFAKLTEDQWRQHMGG